MLTLTSNSNQNVGKSASSQTNLLTPLFQASCTATKASSWFWDSSWLMRPAQSRSGKSTTPGWSAWPSTTSSSSAWSLPPSCSSLVRQKSTLPSSASLWIYFLFRFTERPHKESPGRPKNPFLQVYLVRLGKWRELSGPYKTLV